MIQRAIDSNPMQNHAHAAHEIADEDAPALVHPGTLSPGRSSAALRSHHGKDGVLPAIQSLFYIMVVAIFIITFCVQPFRIPSGSMEPALLVGDFLLVNKQDSTPGPSGWFLPASHIRRGQIVVFHYPINPTMHLIKRVIGMPGDHIKLRNGHVYINNSALSEPYAMYLPSAPDNYRDNFPRLQRYIA